MLVLQLTWSNECKSGKGSKWSKSMFFEFVIASCSKVMKKFRIFSCLLASMAQSLWISLACQLGHITTSWWSLQPLGGDTWLLMKVGFKHSNFIWSNCKRSLQTNDKALLFHITIFRNSPILVIKICSVKTLKSFCPVLKWTRLLLENHHGY